MFSANEAQLNYRAPAETLNACDIDFLTRHKADIIRLLAQKSEAFPKISAGLTHWVAPLSFHQEFLLNAARNGAGSFLNMCSAFRLCGVVDFDILKISFKKVAQRHGALRSGIITIEEQPIQWISQEREPSFETVDISEKGEDDAAHEVIQQLNSFFDERLDLLGDPFFKVKFIKVGEKENILAVRLHHIVSDAVSLQVLFRDLWANYWDIVEERLPSSRALPLQYADYAAWQRSSKVDKHIEYWTARLTGTAALRLPYDRVQLALRTPTIVGFSFDTARTSALRELARRQGASLSMVVLALYAGIVSFWCKQQNFITAFNFIGRERLEDLEAIGLFVFPLPLRIELDITKSFVELIKVVSNEFASAHRHREFGRVVNERPSIIANSFFQWIPLDMPHLVTPVLRGENHERRKLAVNEMLFKKPPLEDERSPGEFAISFNEELGEIIAHVIYRADLFLPTTIQRFVRNLQSFTDCVIRNPNSALDLFRFS